MGRNKLDSRLVRNKLITIRINSLEKEKIGNRSPTKIFRDGLKYKSEFDKARKLRKIKNE